MLKTWKLKSEKEQKPDFQSLPEFIIHIIVVCILTGSIFYVSSEVVIHLFGDKILLLILLGISIVFIINSIVKKIYRLIKRKTG